MNKTISKTITRAAGALAISGLLFGVFGFAFLAHADDIPPLTGTLSGTVMENVGVLHIDSVDEMQLQATADNTFAHGWRYIFNMTIPTDESHVSMKFADWTNTTGPGTVPVATNMRISSGQADNSGATILLTDAEVYSTPSLHMTVDLDEDTPGMQVRVVVETAIPLHTPAGSYGTTYGVQTL